jgi:hypothetical protein
MEINPYESPRVAGGLKRLTAPRQRESRGALLAAAIILPLALLNVIHVVYVLLWT